MYIYENFPLRRLNTFGVNAIAQYLVITANPQEIPQFLKERADADEKLMVIGGGSNLLFTKDFSGTLLKMVNTEIHTQEETDNEIWIQADAGICWDDFVGVCTSMGWHGLENLSDIPGSVGAAPVQNVGAYGVEAKDFIAEVKGYSLQNGEPFTLSNSECKFGYRTSIFKTRWANKAIVTQVVFRLKKDTHLETSYGAVADELNLLGLATPTHLRQAIKNIRRKKLPLPEQLGNAGSFFKNPVIAKEQFVKIQEAFPEVPNYPAGELVKVPAAWLIEQAGLKGYEKGNVATHKAQPLVIVNTGEATGKEIEAFSQLIQQKVQEQFNILLEPEVKIL